MNNAQYEAAVASLATVDTELATLDQTIRDNIAKAREHNDIHRAAANQRTALTAKAEPLRKAVAEYRLILKQQAAAKAKEEAESRAAKAKEEAEKKAAEAEQSELAQLRARVAELEGAK